MRYKRSARVKSRVKRLGVHRVFKRIMTRRTRSYYGL